MGLEPPILTHWVTSTNFMELSPIPRFRAYLGASTPKLGAGRARDTVLTRLLHSHFLPAMKKKKKKKTAGSRSDHPCCRAERISGSCLLGVAISRHRAYGSSDGFVDERVIERRHSMPSLQQQSSRKETEGHPVAAVTQREPVTRISTMGTDERQAVGGHREETVPGRPVRTVATAGSRASKYTRRSRSAALGC